MMRFEVLNKIIERLSYKSYLEVGVYDPEGCFNNIRCALKESIDPYPRSGSVTYVTTSDQGFLYLRHSRKQYDLIFIDGYHQELQADRDIWNALQVLTARGTIVLHDANPPTESYSADYVFFNGQITMLDPATDTALSGSVYKSIIKYNRQNAGNAYVVDSDTGCAVIHKCSRAVQRFEFAPLQMTFDEFHGNRSNLLNLIQPNQLDAKLDALCAEYPALFAHRS